MKQHVKADTLTNLSLLYKNTVLATGDINNNYIY